MSFRRTVVGRAALVVALVIATLAGPSTAAAHVNRIVGRYTFFMILIEEPLFQTNHAGFEFWVHDGDRVVLGLDQTLMANATSGGRTIDLIVSPINARGFYDLDTTVGGQAFDPGAAGDWTLRLTGTVEGESVNVAFPAAFPAYPRVATATRPAAVTPDTGPDVWLLADAVGLAAVVGWIGLKIRRHRVHADPMPSV